MHAISRQVANEMSPCALLTELTYFQIQFQNLTSIKLVLRASANLLQAAGVCQNNCNKVLKLVLSGLFQVLLALIDPAAQISLAAQRKHSISSFPYYSLQFPDQYITFLYRNHLEKLHTKQRKWLWTLLSSNLDILNLLLASTSAFLQTPPPFGAFVVSSTTIVYPSSNKIETPSGWWMKHLVVIILKYLIQITWIGNLSSFSSSR